jgi:hypothetical protein
MSGARVRVSAYPGFPAFPDAWQLRASNAPIDEQRGGVVAVGAR